MIKKKSRFQSQAVAWPYTPEPSPPLAPITITREVDEELIMSEAEFHKSRPIRVASPRDGLISPGGRPTLDDVLEGKAPKPYTFQSYKDYLEEQHCSETLDFTTDSKDYRTHHNTAAAQLEGTPLTTESDEGFDLQMEWMRLLDVYVKPGAPREINLPAEERDDLVDYPFQLRPPPPEALEPALKRMRDLMAESIFIPWCNSLKAAPHAQTYNALSDFASRDSRMDPSRMTFDPRRDQHLSSHRTTAAELRKSSNRRQSPRGSSPSHFEKVAQPSQRSTQSSNLTSSLNRPKSTHLSQLTSNASAVSAAESAVTDDSGSGESHERIPTTPPTTPPASDLGATHGSHNMSLVSPKQQRSDSGGWKKMGMKIWGNKKKGSQSGSLRERSDEY